MKKILACGTDQLILDFSAFSCPSVFHLDVGLCAGSPGGSGGTIQMGQTCPSYPRFSRPLTPVNCPLTWPYQIGRVSGAVTEGRAATASPSTTYNSHVFFPSPWCPHHRQLDGQLGKHQCSSTKWQERMSCHHNNHTQHYQPQSRLVEWKKSHWLEMLYFLIFCCHFHTWVRSDRCPKLPCLNVAENRK